MNRFRIVQCAKLGESAMTFKEAHGMYIREFSWSWVISLTVHAVVNSKQDGGQSDDCANVRSV